MVDEEKDEQIVSLTVLLYLAAAVILGFVYVYVLKPAPAGPQTGMDANAAPGAFDQFLYLIGNAIPSAIVALLALPTAQIFFRRQQRSQRTHNRAIAADISGLIETLSTTAARLSAAEVGQLNAQVEPATAPASTPPAHVSVTDAAALQKRLLEVVHLLKDIPQSQRSPKKGPLLATPWHSVGVRVWVVPRRTDGAALDESAAMKHLMTFRAKDTVPPSNIPWFKGKGVVGACWEQNDLVIYDYSPYKPDSARVAWELVPTDLKLGMSWDEVHALAWRCASVLAAPLTHPDNPQQVIGCLVIDTPTGYPDRLNDDRVRAVLVAAAKGISAMLI